MQLTSNSGDFLLVGIGFMHNTFLGLSLKEDIIEEISSLNLMRPYFVSDLAVSFVMVDICLQ